MPHTRFSLVPKLEGGVREQFTQILHQSFPPSERETVESIDHRLAQGGAQLHGAFADEDLVGFALMLPLDLPGVSLLDYLAVAQTHRNQGLGRAFLDHLRTIYGAAPRSSGILLEVESEQWGSEEERYLRARRIAFYRRNGAVPIPLSEHLRMPAMDGDGHIYTKLMWLPLLDPVPTGERLLECVRSFLRHSYGLEPGDAVAVEALGKVQT